MVQNVRLWNEDGTQGVRALTRALSDLEEPPQPSTSANCDLRLPQIVSIKRQWNFYCVMGAAMQRRRGVRTA